MSFPLASPPGPYFWASNASLKIEDGPVGKDCQASLGNARAELAARGIKGGLKMGRNATPRRRSTFVSQTTVGPILRQPAAENYSSKITEKEVAAKFSNVVTAFSKDDLSGVSGRTSEAAKHWKAASRAPNSSSLINMARRLPIVRDWLISELDMPAAELPSDPNMQASATMAMLQMAANLPGQDGALAKMLLARLQRGEM